MADLTKILLYRMTHIENIPHVLIHGLVHRDSPNADPNYRSIGDGSLIATRNEMVLDNGRYLGEYIPFYFGTRTPMLFVIQKGHNQVAKTPADRIVYCVSSVQEIIKRQHEFVFTDGHAKDKFSNQYSPASINQIDSILDKKAIDSQFWKDKNDLDLKRRKESEFLVLGDIAASAILGYGVYNQNSKNELIRFGIDQNKIAVRPNFYF